MILIRIAAWAAIFCLQTAAIFCAAAEVEKPQEKSQPYHIQHAWLMQPGVSAAEVRRKAGNDLLLYPAAIYGNRHPHELAQFTARFEPAAKPRPFLDARRPLPDEAREWLEASHTDALVAIRDGRIIYEYYAPGMTSESIHMMFSCGKGWTSLAWSPHLKESQLEQKMEAVIAPLRGTPIGAATARQVLDMQTDLDYELSFDERGAATGLLADAHRVSGFGYPDRALPLGWAPFLRKLPGKPAGHGKVWRYVDGNPYAFALFAKETTGLRELDVWQSAIDGLGFEQRSVAVMNAAGELSSAGGFATTARDLAKVGQVFLDTGKVGDQQVFPEDFFRSIFAHKSPHLPAAAPPFTGYRSYWRRLEGRFLIPIDQVWGVGFYGQYLVVDRPSRTVVVKFSTYPRGIDPPDQMDSGYFARDVKMLVPFAMGVPAASSK